MHIDSEPGLELVSDEEFAALALAADPHAPLAADAKPWHYAAGGASPLPSWYMPAAVAVRSGLFTRVVVIAIIFGFLAIDAYGLCITSGFLSIA